MELDSKDSPLKMGDFFLDPNITIKEETTLNDNIMTTSSASVPIPQRGRDLNDYHDFPINQLQEEFPNQWCLMHTEEMLKSDLNQMDDDDIFQVDKADLIQDPTLAELNANTDTDLTDLNFDDLLLPDEQTLQQLNLNNNLIQPQSNSQSVQHNNVFFYHNEELMDLLPKQQQQYNVAFSPLSQTSSNSSLTPPVARNTSVLQQKHSTLHELLIKREPQQADLSILGQSVPSGARNVQQSARNRGLSTSAPTHLGLDQLWQRREPRQHLLSTGSLVEAGSTSSISTGGVLSPEALDLSHDELESDEESDGHYEDFSSENDSDDEERTRPSNMSKKERYFWQYNLQSKGPKGQRLVMKCRMENPHVLNEVQDPVFSADCSVRGIKHSGKARKGDGNDLTPNARKLFSIGKELDKLGNIINDMTPVSELPFNVRPNSRKEKNKLASRACRLKKKAQHEANKIKLNGLESEHKRLLTGISQAKQLIAKKLNGGKIAENQEDLSKHLERIVKTSTKIKIAGHTTEYVNKILERHKGGGGGNSSLAADD